MNCSCFGVKKVNDQGRRAEAYRVQCRVSSSNHLLGLDLALDLGLMVLVLVLYLLALLTSLTSLTNII